MALLGTLVAFLPPTFTASCHLEGGMGESPDGEYIHDAIDAFCVFPRRTQTMRLSEQQEVLFLSNFGTLMLLLRVGGGGWGFLRSPCPVALH